MKKLLVILNGADAPTHVISSAIAIAKATNAMLHAVFLIPFVYKAALAYPFLNDLSLATMDVSGVSIEEENQALTNDNIQLFVDACDNAKVTCKISSGHETPLEELIQHSAFADLVIADAKTDFASTISMPLTVSLSDLLTDAHCPVLLLQEEMRQPAEIILSYDGSFSSIHALKMFSYIFPEWRNVPARLLSITPDKHLEYEEYIKDWLPRHFTNADITLLKGTVKKEITEVIREHEHNTLVVMGAYGRTAISRLFRKSLSNTVINDTKAALFISHERSNA